MNVKTVNPKRILVAPLDWGLGHATRMVPLIQALKARGHYLAIAADGRPFDFLKSRFPDTEIIRAEGYNITYPENEHLLFHLAKSSYALYRAIQKEEKTANEIAARYKADIIISDNRLNFRSDNTRNIYITHQLNIKAGLMSSAASKLHSLYYSKFDEVWVPDNEGKVNLSGELGHIQNVKMPVYYTGIQSRFSSCKQTSTVLHGKLVVLISGPEPQRTIFEEKVLSELHRTGNSAFVLRGLPGSIDNRKISGNVELISHLADQEMFHLIDGADVIISRSGYSTLSDLAKMNKKIIVVPTPGQTEQEYLAERFAQKGMLVTARQQDFNLQECIERTRNIQPFAIPVADQLIAVIDRLEK
jgi:UDP-N-acetylglucosamine:LPS N-acetylglucosamine transferase